MTYSVGESYRSQLQALIEKTYKNKRLCITKYEPIHNSRGLGIGWDNVKHVGRCISAKVDGIVTKNTNYEAYKISVKIIHNDLVQSKEWVILNDSKVEIIE